MPRWVADYPERTASTYFQKRSSLGVAASSARSQKTTLQDDRRMSAPPPRSGRLLARWSRPLRPEADIADRQPPRLRETTLRAGLP